MKKYFFTLITIFILVFSNSAVYASSLWTIIDGLRSDDEVKLASACRALKIECGLKPSKVQVLQPHCIEPGCNLFVIGISFEGPLRGYIILSDAQGKVFDKREAGYITTLSLHPLKSIYANDNLIVDAVAGTGTGTRIDQFYIFSITDKKFNELWTDSSYEKCFQLARFKDQNYEVKCSLSFEKLDNDEMQEIIYVCKHIQYTYDEQTKKLIPGETKKTTKVFKFKNGKYSFLKKSADE